ncbi:MAG: DMT family transporter [Bacillota bacterium]|nr:DMT family transporter [Bacillota bacterium]
MVFWIVAGGKDRSLKRMWAVMAATAFSLEGILARGALATGTDALTVLWLRFLLAFLAVGAAQLLFPPREKKLPSRDLGVLLASGVGYAVTAFLLFAAFQRIATSLAILLLFLYPGLVALGSHLLGRERLTPRHGVALLLAFAGLALLTGTSLQGSLEGILFALGAAVTNALTLLLQQPVMGRVSAYRALTPLLGSAAAASLLLAVFSGKPLWAAGGSWPFLAGLALFPSVAAILGVNKSLQVLGAANTALLLSLETPLAALWGALWLGERFTPLQALGGLLVIFGITWVQTQTGGGGAIRESAG